MYTIPKSVESVINEISKIPGIGPKSATRIAYHFLRSTQRDAEKLAEALKEMSVKVKNCSICYNLCEDDICSICNSPLRDNSKLCVIEEPLDLASFENSGIYNGKYFILGGVISPADGISASDIRIAELKKHIVSLIEVNETLEVIIATNPSLEGEATAIYISDMIKSISSSKIKITRLAMGLPTGADLEFADSLTLKRAFDGRGVYNS